MPFMPSIPQIQGMLLEEVLLHLLRYCGYQPVMKVGRDPTLKSGRSGMEVKGRGEHHQIDAIADFIVPQPFANPSRLLIEAKFRAAPAGIDIVRNAVGVLKDVSEFWAPQEQGTPLPRYHYQYAILSSSGFTKPAQKYAAAQDVYLIPFAKGGYFRPVLDAISGLQALNDPDARVPLPASLSELRHSVRRELAEQGALAFPNYDADFAGSIGAVVQAARSIEYSLLAVAMNRLPIVLTPAPDVRVERLDDLTRVRIRWDEHGWYLDENREDSRRLFSFDLPAELFRRYADQDRLSPERAVQMKQEALADITAWVVRPGSAKLIRFAVDQDWIQQVKNRLRQN